MDEHSKLIASPRVLHFLLVSWLMMDRMRIHLFTGPIASSASQHPRAVSSFVTVVWTGLFPVMLGMGALHRNQVVVAECVVGVAKGPSRGCSRRVIAREMQTVFPALPGALLGILYRGQPAWLGIVRLAGHDYQSVTPQPG